MTNNKIEEALKHHLKEAEMPSLEEIIQVRAEKEFCPKTRKQIDKRIPHKMKYGESRMPKSVVDIDYNYFWPADDYRKFMHGPSQIEREAKRQKMIEKDKELDEKILAFMKEEDKKMKTNFESTGFKKIQYSMPLHILHPWAQELGISVHRLQKWLRKEFLKHAILNHEVSNDPSNKKKRQKVKILFDKLKSDHG